MEKIKLPPASSINFPEGIIWFKNPLIKLIFFYSEAISVNLYPSPKLFFKYKAVPIYLSLPPAITTILSLNISASSILWVVNIITLFFFKFFKTIINIKMISLIIFFYYLNHFPNFSSSLWLIIIELNNFLKNIKIIITSNPVVGS